MSKYPNLSEADSFVMEVLWRRGECKGIDIMHELKGELDWTPQTIRTYLTRLIKKGLVGSKALNRRDFIYYPLVSKVDYATDKTIGILRTYYDSLNQMISCLIQADSISDDELKLLRQMIEQGKSDTDKKIT